VVEVQLASCRDIGGGLRACDYFGVGEPRRQGTGGPHELSCSGCPSRPSRDGAV
jgi:hypothetical protein